MAQCRPGPEWNPLRLCGLEVHVQAYADERLLGAALSRFPGCSGAQSSIRALGLFHVPPGAGHDRFYYRLELNEEVYH